MLPPAPLSTCKFDWRPEAPHTHCYVFQNMRYDTQTNTLATVTYTIQNTCVHKYMYLRINTCIPIMQHAICLVVAVWSTTSVSFIVVSLRRPLTCSRLPCRGALPLRCHVGTIAPVVPNCIWVVRTPQSSSASFDATVQALVVANHTAINQVAEASGRAQHYEACGTTDASVLAPAQVDLT